MYLLLLQFVFGSRFYVSKKGNDSDTCGAKQDPCGSVYYAITNINANDYELVVNGICLFKLIK